MTRFVRRWKVLDNRTGKNFLRSGTSLAFALALSSFLAQPAGAQPAPQSPDISGADPHWIEDTQSHCRAADPDPQPGERIVWTGACENGLLSGSGTLTWYRGGHVEGRDSGTFKAGALTGAGKIVEADGTIYEGDFPGLGVLTLPDGRTRAGRSVREQSGWSIQEIPPAR